MFVEGAHNLARMVYLKNPENMKHYIARLYLSVYCITLFNEVQKGTINLTRNPLSKVFLISDRNNNTTRLNKRTKQLTTTKR